MGSLVESAECTEEEEEEDDDDDDDDDDEEDGSVGCPMAWADSVALVPHPAGHSAAVAPRRARAWLCSAVARWSRRHRTGAVAPPAPPLAAAASCWRRCHCGSRCGW